MRRKAGALVPLELAICTAAVELRGQGTEEFHGYLIAKEIKEHADPAYRSPRPRSGLLPLQLQ